MGPGHRLGSRPLRPEPGRGHAAPAPSWSAARHATWRHATRSLRELRDRATRSSRHSERALAAWRDDIRPKLEQQIGQTQRAYEAGELPLLAVLDMSRRLNDSRAARARRGRRPPPRDRARRTERRPTRCRHDRDEDHETSTEPDLDVTRIRTLHRSSLAASRRCRRGRAATTNQPRHPRRPPRSRTRSRSPTSRPSS